MDPTALLVDGFGRRVADVRISVTDRCNFRCVYCMPEAGLPLTAKSAILSFEEIERVVRVLQSLGVTSVRLTGGEPLVRAGIESLVERLGRLGLTDLAMSTNAFLLADQAAALASAGLRRVNISMDSLLQHRFAEITRRDALAQVHAGIEAAREAGLGVKVNCVVMRGTNDDELLDFARLARATGLDVRFIENMPLDADERWTSGRVVPSTEILSRIGAQFPLVHEPDAHRPAERYRFADGAPGGIGVIASVTQPFCERCDRIRLTADGQLRTCLFALDETDLRGLLRSTATDADIVAAVRTAVAGKWAGHRIGQPEFVRPARSMSKVGG